MIKLQHASKVTGCNIYGKAEYANPGGSVKDRAALYLIQDAEERGILTPGKPGIVLEATAGNTGVGLSLCGNSKGYRTVIVIPETQTKEKKDTLRACGAYLIESAALPFKNQGNYVHVARRLSILLRKHLKQHNVPVYYPNQWDNTANLRAHEETTAVEIYHQLQSIGLEVDGFNCAVGTGGSLVGTSTGLRALNPKIKIALTDPMGALPYTYYTTGEARMGAGSSITEGIGQSRVTGNLQHQNWRPDLMYEIDDTTALNTLNTLNYSEGLQVGLSAGINVAGAMKLAHDLGPGKTIVTLLCDNAMRYGSKMYNLPFLHSKNLPTPYWMDSGLWEEQGAGQSGGVDQYGIHRFINRNSSNGSNGHGSDHTTATANGQYKIDPEIHLLPELFGKINLDDLVKEAIENHDITE